MGKIQVSPVFYKDLYQDGTSQYIHECDQYTSPNGKDQLSPKRTGKTKKETYIQHHQFQSITSVRYPEGLHSAATDIDTGGGVEDPVLHIVIPHLYRRISDAGRKEIKHMSRGKANQTRKRSVRYPAR